jgi:hypothetical protein
MVIILNRSGTKRAKTVTLKYFSDLTATFTEIVMDPHQLGFTNYSMQLQTGMGVNKNIVDKTNMP